MTLDLLHIGLIMDGNGRWAKKQYKPRFYGHKQGLQTFKNIIAYAGQHKQISEITAFALSKDNLRRSYSEISALIGLLNNVIKNELKWFQGRGISVNFIGDLSYFTDDMRHELSDFAQATAQGSALRLNVAINYSGKQEILDTILSSSAKSVAEVEDLLNYRGIDLLIRTSGEQRLSDFCLWQLAYSELYFTDVLWPDFSVAAFEQALVWFFSRERRFGIVDE